MTPASADRLLRARRVGFVATLRRLVVSLALAALALFASTNPLRLGSDARGDDPRPTFYVYLHTDSKFATLEKILKEKMPHLAVTVFGRFRDLEDSMQTRRPDALLGLHALLVELGVKPSLQGIRGNVDSEPYVLLSLEGALAGPLDGKVIGTVDFLGRTGTQEFVANLLGIAGIKLKRVTKMEDLLPLLQFSAADAVLVPASSVKEMTDRSRLPLRVRVLPDSAVKLPAVGVLNGQVRTLVVDQLERIDAETLRLLGIDQWRAP